MDAIKKRRSVRTYTGQALQSEDIKKINTYISDEKNVIGINGNIINIELKEVSGNSSGKIGTYGFIKKSPAFLIVICENTQSAMLDVGYVFEKLFLFLTKNGLGTCWLGGTFNRHQFDIKGTYGEKAYIPVISPVGYQAEKQSMTEKIVRKNSNGDFRNDFDTMFFNGDFRSKVNDTKIRQDLEMVRLAPSASNKQPWRVLMSADGTANFYIERTPNYVGEKLAYDIQWLDIGIALSHYEIATGKNKFVFEKPKVEEVSSLLEYVMSVK